MLKAVLQLKQTSRTVCSTIFDVFIIPHDLPEVAAAADEDKRYNELVQDPDQRPLVQVPPHSSSSQRSSSC